MNRKKGRGWAPRRRCPDREREREREIERERERACKVEGESHPLCLTATLLPHCNAPVAVDDMRRERRGTERRVGGTEGEAGEGVSDGVGG